MNTLDHLLDSIQNRTARVGVIGLGYVGLPLALLFEESGFSVVGFDVDAKKPEALHRGESYIKHIGAERVAAAFARGRIAATTDFDRLPECDAVIVCVPTPLGRHREPDMSYIQKTADEIARRLRRGQLVVLESTTYPGTTREELLPRFAATGLACGTDFFLAFSPEREDPGNPSFHTQNIPKVVGGIDEPSQRAACALYGAAVDRVVPVGSPEVAESAKLLENVFRSVNIALVNELKVVFDRMGIDVWEVIEAAKTKPFGFMPFYPGPGLGGHCLAGTESVRVRDGSSNTVVRLADLFESRQASDTRLDLPDGQALLPTGLEALSIDPQTGQEAWKPVSFLFRRPYEGPIATVRLAGGRILRTTDRHPMLVLEDDELVVRKAQDLKAGDLVPVHGGVEEAAPALAADEGLPQDPGSAPIRRLEQPQIRIPGTASLQRLARLLGGEKQRKLDRLAESRRGVTAPRRTIPWKGASVVPVLDVRLEEGSEPVFSVEVPGSHTFAATGGVFVHNCIPLDPFYLTWKAAEHGVWARFIELAGEVNTRMPEYVVDRTVKALNQQGKSIKGAKVLVLGLSYKADIDDDRESPSFELLELFHELGAEVAYCDPYIPRSHRGRKHAFVMESAACTAEELGRHDAVVVSTAHRQFKDPALYQLASLVVDSRNIVPRDAFPGMLVKA